MDDDAAKVERLTKLDELRAISDELWEAHAQGDVPRISDAIYELRETHRRLAAQPATQGQGRVAELEQRLRDCIVAMETWGSWEDGIPDGDHAGEYGFVGKAYDSARMTLGIADQDGKRNAAYIRKANATQGQGPLQVTAEEYAAALTKTASTG